MFAEDKVEIGLLVIAIVDPPVTEIALTIDVAVTEVEDILDMVFVAIATDEPFDELIAVTKLPVLDNELIVLFEMVLVGEAEEFVIPTTLPVADDNPVMVLELVLLIKVVAG